MEQYKQAFGEDYPLGIRIPEYFEDQSYRNDAGPSFAYVLGNRLIKISVLPENPKERDIEEAMRYTLMEMKTEPGDDYQEFVEIRFESDSPEAFEKVIFDKGRLNNWLDA